MSRQQERGTAAGPVVVLAAAGLTTLALLPATLLGAQAVLVGEDVTLSESRLGLAVSVYFLTAAVVVVPAGQVVERAGHRIGAFLAVCFAVASMLGIAAAGSYLQIVVFLGVGGVANALAQASSNLLLARAVPVRKQGVAFGVKQAAIPAALLASGVAVPLLGATVGWRWSFVAAAIVATVVAVMTFRRARPSHRGDRRPQNSQIAVRPLLVIAIATVIASAITNALGAFVVTWGARAGMTVPAAGALLACGSGICIVARIASGVLADLRDSGELRVVAVQLSVSAAGLAALAAGRPGWVIAGAVLAFLGWSWPGLLVLAIVRTHRAAPATATGIIQAGAFLGGAIGPALFGVIVAGISYPVAWTLAAVGTLGAALLVLHGRRLLLRGPTS